MANTRNSLVDSFFQISHTCSVVPHACGGHNQMSIISENMDISTKPVSLCVAGFSLILYST